MTAFRDTVMDALLARLQAQCGATFSFYSRRFMTWEQIIQDRQNASSPIAQPALFLFDGMGLGGGTDKVEPRGKGSPSVVTMQRTIVVYARTPGGGTPHGPDATTPGGTVFYPLLESIESGMASDTPSQNTLTLGKIVSHCWIEGEVHIVTPDIDPTGQGMMVVPVNIMLLPNYI